MRTPRCPVVGTTFTDFAPEIGGQLHSTPATSGRRRVSAPLREPFSEERFKIVNDFDFYFARLVQIGTPQTVTRIVSNGSDNAHMSTAEFPSHAMAPFAAATAVKHQKM